MGEFVGEVRQTEPDFCQWYVTVFLCTRNIDIQRQSVQPPAVSIRIADYSRSNVSHLFFLSRCVSICALLCVCAGES